MGDVTLELVESHGKHFIDLRVAPADPTTWARPSRDRLRVPLESYLKLEAAIAQLRTPVRAKLTELRNPLRKS